MFTVHNMAYQGNFPAYVFSELDLPFSMLNPDGIEFYGQVSFLKAGFYYADKVTTSVRHMQKKSSMASNLVG